MNQPARGQQPLVQAVKLGDTNYALLGVGLTIEIDKDTGALVVGVSIAGGRISEVIGIQPVQAKVVELARIFPPAAAEMLRKAEEARDVATAAGALAAL